MGVFKTCKYYIRFYVGLVSVASFLSSAHALSTDAVQHVLDVPPSDENTPALASSPAAAPVPNTKVPSVGKPLSNHGQRSPLGFQQQRELNIPQEDIKQPLSGLTQSLSSLNQPVSGATVPFAALNQPFGRRGSQGLLRNLPFASGVSVKKTSVLGVILFSLITLMATL